jgi:hypothetical protein
MPRVTCRCGEKLKVPTDNAAHLKCAQCGARIRLRNARHEVTTSDGDGFIRFLCPCGRRLKVTSEDRPKAGRCPDCGRVVPVPTSTLGTLNATFAKNDAETRTQDLDATDLAELDKWCERYSSNSGQYEDDSAKTGKITSVQGAAYDNVQLLSGAITRASVVKLETGLRICPQCQKPLHLGADNCRGCGTLVPRQ